MREVGGPIEFNPFRTMAGSGHGKSAQGELGILACRTESVPAMRVVDRRPQQVLEQGIEAAEGVACPPAIGNDQVQHGRALPALYWKARPAAATPFNFAPSTNLKLSTIITINSEFHVQLDRTGLGG